MDLYHEPRVLTPNYFSFRVDQKARDVDQFFKTVQASNWCLDIYFTKAAEQPNVDLSFDQLVVIFTDSLDQIKQLNAIPVSLRGFCKSYISWLQVKLPYLLPDSSV